MKSAAIASALFASLAFAAPLNKRVLSTKTHTVIQTVVVYTTVWDNQPAAEATSTQALFFENKSSSSSSAVVSTSSSAVVVEPTPEPTPEPAPSTPPVQAPSSSSQAPPPQEPSPEPKPSPSPTPAPAPAPKPSPEPKPEPAPQPKPSPQPEPKPEPKPEPQPQPQPSQPSGGSGGGESHSGSLTMNYYAGGLGACGEPVSDSDMVAALAVEGFGDSTYDVATGNPTNKWCGKKIRVTYNGKTADAKIMDRCPGCTGSGGLDATPALWEALTGGIGGASGDRLNSGMSWTVIG